MFQRQDNPQFDDARYGAIMDGLRSGADVSKLIDEVFAQAGVAAPPSDSTFHQKRELIVSAFTRLATAGGEASGPDGSPITGREYLPKRPVPLADRNLFNEAASAFPLSIGSLHKPEQGIFERVTELFAEGQHAMTKSEHHVDATKLKKPSGLVDLLAQKFPERFSAEDRVFAQSEEGKKGKSLRVETLTDVRINGEEHLLGVIAIRKFAPLKKGIVLSDGVAESLARSPSFYLVLISPAGDSSLWINNGAIHIHFNSNNAASILEAARERIGTMLLAPSSLNVVGHIINSANTLLTTSNPSGTRLPLDQIAATVTEFCNWMIKKFSEEPGFSGTFHSMTYSWAGLDIPKQILTDATIKGTQDMIKYLKADPDALTRLMKASTTGQAFGDWRYLSQSSPHWAAGFRGASR